MAKENDKNSIEIKIIYGYSIKKTISEINEERLNPKIWGWCYISLKSILDGIKNFSKELEKVGVRKILDLGCGTKPYKRLFNFAEKYVGYDIEKNREVDVVGFNWELPFKDDEFDSLISTQVLEHTEKINETIQEIRRVVKNNGLIFISVPFVFPEHEIPNDFFRFSQYGLRKIFCDFDVLEVKPSNGYVGTVLLVINNFIHYIPGSKIFAPLIFFLNNIMASFFDWLVKVLVPITNSQRMRDIHKYYYLGFPANYTLICRVKK